MTEPVWSSIVLETGLGGRLDATNAIGKPLISVITSIGMDHRQYLGDTSGRNCMEKAGIFKKGVPVLFADAQEASSRVIEKRAAEIGVPCKKIGKDAYEILGIRDKHIAFSCVNAYYGDTTWTLDNIGLYQPSNAILALEAMRHIFGNEGNSPVAGSTCWCKMGRPYGRRYFRMSTLTVHIMSVQLRALYRAFG